MREGLWLVLVVASSVVAMPSPNELAAMPGDDLGAKTIVAVQEPKRSDAVMTLAATSLTPEQMEGGAVRERLSVCVPCIPRDMAKLPNMLRSIRSGTTQPDEIIIAISETTNEQAASLQSLLSGISPGIKILYTPERQTAGQNRNRAFAASSGEYISFFDADDEMHPQRLQIVREALEQTSSKCVIHGYTMSRETNNFDWHAAYQVKGAAMFRNIVDLEHSNTVEVKAEGVRIVSRHNGLGPHHGHPTCRAGVLKRIKFPSDERGQDSMFLRKVLQFFGEQDRSMLYVDLPLTMYFPSDHQDNEGYRTGPKAT